MRSAISPYAYILTHNPRHRYFSYGASVEPNIWSVFRLSYKILAEAEGPNDGLVSVASSRWGGDQGYKGTLVGVSHLDLINWTNRLKWVAGEMMGYPRKFNAIALYLDIAGELTESISGAGCLRRCYRYVGEGGSLIYDRDTRVHRLVLGFGCDLKIWASCLTAQFVCYVLSIGDHLIIEIVLQAS